MGWIPQTGRREQLLALSWSIACSGLLITCIPCNTATRPCSLALPATPPVCPPAATRQRLDGTPSGPPPPELQQEIDGWAEALDECSQLALFEK